MRFLDTPLAGAFVLELQRREDERGFFARYWCEQEAARQGIHVCWVQMNLSWNARQGTLRGLHFQIKPHDEAKLVRCSRGAIFDVIVDLRQGSPTLGRWFAVTLSAAAQNLLYIPAGFAHGFQTLSDDVEVVYHMSRPHHPGSARGIRWDDPDLGIPWPKCARRIIGERDRAWPGLRQWLQQGEAA